MTNGLIPATLFIAFKWLMQGAVITNKRDIKVVFNKKVRLTLSVRVFNRLLKNKYIEVLKDDTYIITQKAIKLFVIDVEGEREPLRYDYFNNEICRRGLHKKTPENTMSRNRCRLCHNESSKRSNNRKKVQQIIGHN